LIFGGKGWLRIDAGEVKDATAGREFQFTSWMREVLERQRKYVSKVERRTKAVIPWLFCRGDGVRIYRFYEPWRDACKLAGIQRIPMTFVGRQSEISSAPVCLGRRPWR
jgi:hypothetical protein